MTKEKTPRRLYIKITLVIFLSFIAIFLITCLIIWIILLTPLKDLVSQHALVSLITPILLAYLSSAIIASLVCYYIIGRYLRPLVILSEKSKKVAEGDFSISIKETSRIPELQNAIFSFNHMVKELNKIEILSNDFINNVSHEFKTPLSIIRSNINLLESNNLDEQEKKQCMNQIKSSIDNISTLVSNILRINRLDNNSIKLEKKFFRLDEQIRQSILNLAHKIEEKNIELDIDLTECLLFSDENLLMHVWDNLLSNSIKFTPKDGLIKISLIKEKNVKIIIEDNGCGMDQETIKHIFDRFYQGETSHSEEGNGLGLTLVKKILRLCNAKIEVQSEVGKGSKFTVKFLK